MTTPTNSLNQLDQRVGIFIDVQNMFYAAKHLYNSKLNFARLMDYIARRRPLVRAIAYVVQTPEIDQSNFLTMLRSNGYEVRSKDLKQRPDGSAKGDWDMGLALDALAMTERLDVVAIVSGDGDFVDLVNFLKARGVRVEVYSFPYSTAEELRYAATEYFQMGPEIVINPQPRSVNGHSVTHNVYRSPVTPDDVVARAAEMEVAEMEVAEPDDLFG
ncbi:MAG TPA: NYN domain-containing protein [Abditibacteriaceae bacterium]|nr:NYN domain-containing protein [Abditibacteriaceae bacterium]